MKKSLARNERTRTKNDSYELQIKIMNQVSKKQDRYKYDDLTKTKEYKNAIEMRIKGSSNKISSKRM